MTLKQKDLKLTGPDAMREALKDRRAFVQGRNLRAGTLEGSGSMGRLDASARKALLDCLQPSAYVELLRAGDAAEGQTVCYVVKHYATPILWTLNGTEWYAPIHPGSSLTLGLMRRLIRHVESWQGNTVTMV